MSLETYWLPIAERRFDGQDLAAFLKLAHNSLPPGTLAAELGRTLIAEEIEGRSPLALVMADLTELRSTTRIDGILPLQIPQVTDLQIISRQLLEFAMEMGLDYPREPAACLDDISLSYLSLLHRRPIRVIAGLEISLFIDCPHSAVSGRKPEMALMATLPLGGTITAFTTAMKGRDRLSHGLREESIGYSRHLAATRHQDGILRLREDPKR